MNSHSPGPDRAARLYQGDAGHAYHEQKRAVPPAALGWVMRLRADKLQPMIRPTDTVVEFGVGAGWNLGRLQCARRIGCDAADFLAERVRSLGIEFVAELKALPDAVADVVLCHHTLEHLLKPAEALIECQRLLKPKGKLLLYVPCDHERRHATYSPEEPNHHLFAWDAQSVGNLVVTLGYQPERIATRRYGYDRFAATLALRLRLGEAGFRLLRRLLVALRPLREVEVISKRGTASTGERG